MDRDPSDFPGNPNPPAKAPQQAKAPPAPKGPATSAGSGALPPESQPASDATPLAKGAGSSLYTISEQENGAHDVFSMTEDGPQKLGTSIWGKKELQSVMGAAGAVYDKDRGVYENVPENVAKVLAEGPQTLTSEVKHRLNAGMLEFHRASLGLALADGKLSAEDFRQRTHPDLVQLQLDRHPAQAWHGLGDAVSKFIEHPIDEGSDIMKHSVSYMAEQLPALADLSGAAMGGAAVGGTLAAFAGPEAIPVGMKIGATTGTFFSLYRQELGARMATLADRGLGDKDIHAQAPGEAVKSAVGAAIFMYGVEAMAAPFKARFLQSLGEGTPAAKTLAEKASSWAYNYGVNAGIKMPAVGVVHQMTSDLMDNLSALVEKRPDLMKSPLDFSNNAIEAAAGMAKLGVIGGVPGAVFEAGMGALDHRAEMKLRGEVDAKLKGVERREPSVSPSPEGQRANPQGEKTGQPSPKTGDEGLASQTPPAHPEKPLPKSADLSSPYKDSITEHPAFVKAVEQAKEHGDLPAGTNPHDREAVMDAYDKAAQEMHDYKNFAMAGLIKVDPETGAKSIVELTPDEENQISATIDHMTRRVLGLRDLAQFARDPEAKAARMDWIANGQEGEEPPVPVDPHNERAKARTEAAAPAGPTPEQKLDETLADKEAKPADIVKAATPSEKVGEKVQETTVKGRAAEVKSNLEALQQRIGEIASTRDRMQKNGLSTYALDRQVNGLVDEAVAAQKELELLQRRDPSEIEVSKKAKLEVKPATLQDITNIAFKEGGKQSQERAREMLKIAEDNGLTASDVKKLVGNKAPGAMGELAYKNFVNGFERKADSPKQGFTRLYRGEESGGEIAPGYDAKKFGGRWFTTSKKVADSYTFQNDKPKISYVDVPTADVDKYITSNDEDARKAGYGVRDDDPTERLLPREIADQKKPLTEHVPGFREGVQKLVERKAARAEVASILREKQIERAENIRRLEKLPVSSKMTTEQLKKYADVLRTYDKGDTALTPKLIEALNGTKFEGVRTEGEARARAEKITGLPAEDFKNLKLGHTPRALPEPNARYWHPALGLVFDTTGEIVQKGIRLGDVVNARLQALAAEAIRERRAASGLGARIADWLAPQQREVFEYTEETDPQKLAAMAEKMTPAELKWADARKQFYNVANAVLERKGMVSRFVGKYNPGIAKGLPEIVRDAGRVGLWGTLKELVPVEWRKDSEVVGRGGNILDYEKEMKQTRYRTGALDPSKNLVKADAAYIHDYYMKGALDEAVPYVQLLTESLEDRNSEGAKFGSSLAAFTKEFLNNKKGENYSAGNMGEWVAPVLRFGQTAAGIHFLAGNYALQAIKLGVAVPLGKFMAIDSPIDYARTIGLRFTDEGKTFLKNHEAVIGKDMIASFKEPAQDIGDYTKKALFGGFQAAHQRALGDVLLAAATPEELKAGRMSDARVNEVLQVAGRWLNFHGHESVYMKNPIGQAMTQYKAWYLPPTLTLAEDVHALTKAVVSRGKEPMTPRQMHEVLKLSLMGGAVAASSAILTKDMEDDTLRGQMIHYLRHSMGSMWRGLNADAWTSIAATTYLAKLGHDLTLLGELEKTGPHEGENKGVVALKRDLTPRIVKDVTKFVSED